MDNKKGLSEERTKNPASREDCRIVDCVVLRSWLLELSDDRLYGTSELTNLDLDVSIKRKVHVDP